MFLSSQANIFVAIVVISDDLILSIVRNLVIHAGTPKWIAN